MNVLLVEDRIPRAWLGAGFPRTLVLLRALRDLGHHVTLYAAATAAEREPVARAVPAWDVAAERGPDALEGFLARHHANFDALIVSRPHNMWLFSEIHSRHPQWFAATMIVYDAEAVFALRDQRQRALQGRPLSPAQAQAELSVEVDLAAQADAVLAVSAHEARVFREGGCPAVYELGHAVTVTPTPAPFTVRRGLLFVGAVHTATGPNADALQWFVAHVWPHVRQKLGPEVTLTIAGLVRAEQVTALASAAVRLTGVVDDLTPLYNSARVCIAPVRFAAGIPLKIYEAAANGVPVVTTPSLAEALGWTRRELSIAASPDQFAEECIRLYEEQPRWERQRTDALARVAVDGSYETFRETVRQVLHLRQPH